MSLPLCEEGNSFYEGWNQIGFGVWGLCAVAKVYTSTAGLSWGMLWHVSRNCWSAGCKVERHTELLSWGILDSAWICKVATELCKLDCVCTSQEGRDGGLSVRQSRKEQLGWNPLQKPAVSVQLLACQSTFLQSLSSLHLKTILSALELLCETAGSLFSHTG